MSNIIATTKKIREVTGTTKWSHLRCPSCPKPKIANNYELLVTFPWAVKLSCNESNHSDWYVCKICNHLRKPLLTQSNINLHNFKYHNTTSLNCPLKKKQKIAS